MSDHQQPGADQPGYGGDQSWQGQGQPGPGYGQGGAPQYGAQTPPAQYPGGPGQPAYGGPGGQPLAPQAQGVNFFKALFDFSFTHFITPMIVKVVYIIALIVLVLSWLIFLISAFDESAGLGIAVLFLGPVVVLLYLAFIRMTLEFYLAITRMSEDIHKRLR